MSTANQAQLYKQSLFYESRGLLVLLRHGPLVDDLADA
jgi:hypothetical protein